MNYEIGFISENTQKNCSLDIGQTLLFVSGYLSLDDSFDSCSSTKNKQYETLRKRHHKYVLDTEMAHLSINQLDKIAKQ